MGWRLGSGIKVVINGVVGVLDSVGTYVANHPYCQVP